MSFSVFSIETIVFLLAFLLFVSNFPFETLIVFSLVSNLLVLRFLSVFCERVLRDAVHRRNQDRTPEADSQTLA